MCRAEAGRPAHLRIRYFNNDVGFSKVFVRDHLLWKQLGQRMCVNSVAVEVYLSPWRAFHCVFCVGTAEPAIPYSLA
jgi:hypothetical protein